MRFGLDARLVFHDRGGIGRYIRCLAAALARECAADSFSPIVDFRDGDWSDGARRVIEEYRAAGKIRFVGLTGHTAPAQFERMVSEYDFDAILNPVGPINRVWNDFIDTSMAAAEERGMGRVGMKVMAYGQVPVEDRPLYLRYAMSYADVAIVGMDTVEQVEENVQVAEAFAPLEPKQEEALLARALELIPKVRKELWWLPEERIAS